MDPTLVGRREVLSLPLVLAAGQAVAGQAVDGATGTGRELLDFRTLARRWAEAAAELVEADPAFDDVYVGRLHALLSRWSRTDLPAWIKKNESPSLDGGPIFVEARLAAIRFDLRPGAVIRPHDHPPLVVCTAGVAGTCSYRHFESVGAKPAHASPATFLVRETRRGVLEPGRFTPVTRERDWIHTFEAGDEGATIVDFVCTLGGDQKDWSHVEIAAEPRDARKLVHEAVWKARD